jgi:hypothetical protein
MVDIAFMSGFKIPEVFSSPILYRSHNNVNLRNSPLLKVHCFALVPYSIVRYTHLNVLKIEVLKTVKTITYIESVTFGWKGLFLLFGFEW